MILFQNPGIFLFEIKLKPWLTNTLLVFTATLVSLVAFEAVLRLSGSQWERERSLFAEPPPRPRYTQLPDGLYQLSPTQRLLNSGICFESISVATNAVGFRGLKDWPAEGGLLLLGDSFIEALQVPDGLTVADVLERQTGRPVLNAGVSGFGTVAELRLWRAALQIRRPEAVILFFYLGNDVADNSCALTSSRAPCSNESKPPVNVSPSSRLPSNETVGNSGGGWWPYLRRHLALYSFMHDARMIFEGFVSAKTPIRWNLYANPLDPQWESAWAETEIALDLLSNEIGATGSKLFLVAIPEHLAVADNPERMLRFSSGAKPPIGFDPESPSRRLMDIAARLNIPALDLLPIFKAYRQRHNLPSPYFSYSCDGHWNPLGHHLAATAVSDFLGYGSRLSQVMASPSRQILGEAAFQEIYVGGIYRPTIRAAE
ncbi:MAG: SGNH/GDSL hydrolase family protein [Alphaproteobacteria bacterium]|nr:SGNH/GDSL hydrolase family protein [Alphaproteobacteria bacterium]